ncbi:unnamed protein product [Chrysodeixis includens]|uniref:Uncharacterized protein n=1 Tax=Chrysodeixis includens TaxID=689277 RepID=A0A9P0FVW8_CHRIL|nr:unnamed protein product [Chrysodeixis includens]
MKLFVFAALIAVAAAARLEHLERRAYLPPFQSGGSDSSNQGSFGSQQGSFGSNGAFGSAGAGQNGGSFGLATSNKYLPPDHSSSASNGAPQFSGSLTGFGSQNNQGQQYGQQGSQYAIPSTNYGVPQGSTFGSQSQYSQQSGANRQYLAPRPSALENPPQQAFDEETGYHY